MNYEDRMLIHTQLKLIHRLRVIAGRKYAISRHYASACSIGVVATRTYALTFGRGSRELQTGWTYVRSMAAWPCDKTDPCNHRAHRPMMCPSSNKNVESMNQRNNANKGSVMSRVRMYVCLRSFEKAISLSPWYVIVVHWTWVCIHTQYCLMGCLMKILDAGALNKETDDQNVRVHCCLT